MIVIDRKSIKKMVRNIKNTKPSQKEINKTALTELSFLIDMHKSIKEAKEKSESE